MIQLVEVEYENEDIETLFIDFDLMKRDSNLS